LTIYLHQFAEQKEHQAARILNVSGPNSQCNVGVRYIRLTTITLATIPVCLFAFGALSGEYPDSGKWGKWPGYRDAAGIEQDGADLILMCMTKEEAQFLGWPSEKEPEPSYDPLRPLPFESTLSAKLAASDHTKILILREPRAHWQEGEVVDVMPKSDMGDRNPTPLRGIAMGPTRVLIHYKYDLVGALLIMAQAKASFTLSAGGYSRTFPRAKMKAATGPVLRACNDDWAVPDQ
jgi:hypothetical protein